MAAKKVVVQTIGEKDGTAFGSTTQALASLPTEERSLSQIYFVQNGSEVDRYFFKDGVTDADFTLWETDGGSPAYDSYIAILSQTGTNNPTVTVINSADDNYLGAITWTRDGAGEYTGAKSGAFTEGKTIIFINQGNTTGLVRLFRVNANALSLTQVDTTDGTNVDVFADVSVEIRVYP